MKKAISFCMSLLPLAIAGCHTPLVETTIINQGPAVHVMEFDYPSASFGANVLPAGGIFRYRFRIQGSGVLTLQYQDSAGHNHTAVGPQVEQGQQGPLTVTINAENRVSWQPALKK